MKAILTGKRYEQTWFAIDVEFRRDNDTVITTKTLYFSGASLDITMQDVKDRVALEAQRLEAIGVLNQDPDAVIGTDLLLP